MEARSSTTIEDPREREDFDKLSPDEQSHRLKVYLEELKSAMAERLSERIKEFETLEKIRQDAAYQKARADILEERERDRAKREENKPAKKSSRDLEDDVFARSKGSTPLFGKTRESRRSTMFGFRPLSPEGSGSDKSDEEGISRRSIPKESVFRGPKRHLIGDRVFLSRLVEEACLVKKPNLLPWPIC